VAQAFEWTDTDGVDAGCPVHHGSFAEQPPAQDRVEWAGLPINLDFAFSREQRDKVYAQHLMFTRHARFSRWSRNDAQRCSCGSTADHDR
jgi:hypothetical protein